MRITHPFVNGQADGGDATVTRPSDWNAAHILAATVDSKTANYTITAADNGKIIRAAHSANIIFTLPATGGLQSNWSVWIENSQTGVNGNAELDIDPDGTDTIDGLGAGVVIVTWPGDLRLVRLSAANTWESILFRGGAIEVQTTAGAALRWPSRANRVFAELWGAGGGGASGERGAAGTARYGGCGGGGGGKLERIIRGSALAASTALTATCGVGGAGAAARTTDGIPVNGTDGGNSSLAASGLKTLYGFGGAGGEYLSGGGGGGIASAATNIDPGHAGFRFSNTPIPHEFGGGYGSAAGANSASSSVFGGGGGGSQGGGGGAGNDGGRSIFGGGGGGGGGSSTSGNVASAGGAGGSTGQVVPVAQNGGGAAGGAIGTAGTAGSATPTIEGPDVGGGAGGSALAANGGNGAVGGRCCGGGGGGSTQTGTSSGAGGAGGDGLIRISYW